MYMILKAEMIVRQLEITGAHALSETTYYRYECNGLGRVVALPIL